MRNNTFFTLKESFQQKYKNTLNFSFYWRSRRHHDPLPNSQCPPKGQGTNVPIFLGYCKTIDTVKTHVPWVSKKVPHFQHVIVGTNCERWDPKEREKHKRNMLGIRKKEKKESFSGPKVFCSDFGRNFWWWRKSRERGKSFVAMEKQWI